MQAVNRFIIEPAYDVQEVNAWIGPNSRRGLPAVQYGLCEGRVSVCGNGPSLRSLYPGDGPIVALNGAWRTLVANGVMPDYIVAFDPAKENVAWFKDAPSGVTYLLASSMHPDVFEATRNKIVHQWHCACAEELKLGLHPLIDGGFTVGCLSLNLLHKMGFTHFDLYGYDSCYALDGRHHATEQNWHLTDPKVYQVGERAFLAEPWMAAQVQFFLEQIEANRWNYTVDVKGDGMLAAALKHNTMEVLYDLDTAPGSYDFLNNMLNAENYRKLRNYSRVHVHFKPGKNDGFRSVDVIDIGHEQKSLMLNKVARPMVEMFGFTEVDSVSENAMQFTYISRPSTDIYRETGHLPVYHASREATEWAQQFAGVITITLREAEHWPMRNSDKAEWIKFSQTLKGRVIFVRDTCKADEPVEGFETCPEASRDLHKRLALYRGARMNFFTTQGPACLTWFTKDIPYVNIYTPTPGYHCYDQAWLAEYHGVEPDGQLPWHDPSKQRIVRMADTCENIASVWTELEATCGG